MSHFHIDLIAGEMSLPAERVTATIGLLDDEATVPFIARYRKEVTGSLDEVQITSIRDRIMQLRELDKRREAIIKSLEERDLLTDELSEKVAAAETLAELEDIYLPFRPKRRTRATIAVEKGLEPLAEMVFTQDDIDPITEAGNFIDEEKKVASAEEALAGARDIIAAWINEDSDARARMRELFTEEALLVSKVISGKENEGTKYADYFDWTEPLLRAPSHRILAIRRGENEGYLSMTIAPPEETALGILTDMFVTGANAASDQVREALTDGYRRLLAPAMETEMRSLSRQRADGEAINVFATNLRELLMAPPLGGKNILALDPGFRTGCKLVCLDSQGGLLHYQTIFPHKSEKEKADAASEVKALCDKYKIKVVAVGNGTAGRETKQFLHEIGLPDHIAIEMVNESGASIYSASEVAREEFPEHDITVRGAVSIGRRLMDPLAELVKIDPKSIGVGQYQHDVDQGALRQSLDDTVVSCVNAVGVEVNTASKQLLTYVSGLGPNLAGKIVAYRAEKGPFRSRREFTRVSRLGPKAFEQAAGFLRISDAAYPLDRSAVHPESYEIVENMATDLGCTVDELITEPRHRDRIKLDKYCTDTVGLPTLTDIMDELARPGRDPRPQFESFRFDDAVKTIEDVQPGMVLPGIVTNVTAFGAFVDIGVHQDGLVHISELSESFIKDPADIVKVHQRVKVTVLTVDRDRNRIGLSLRKDRPVEN